MPWLCSPHEPAVERQREYLIRLDWLESPEGVAKVGRA